MDNIKIIKTKDTFGKVESYEVVEKIPAGFFVWNIGKNMGTDEYIPLCQDLYPNDKDDYSINPDTLKAIKLNPEYVKLLRKAAAYGIDDLKKAKQESASKRVPKSYRAKRKRELAIEALPIFMKITE